jgi:hypothetical protein
MDWRSLASFVASPDMALCSLVFVTFGDSISGRWLLLRRRLRRWEG